jgi:hypothetical protein
VTPEERIGEGAGDTQVDLLASLRRLTDAELVARVEDLARRERGATALLVAHLAELDTRDVYLRAGYSSLFTYCRDALGLSEHEAYNRIEVARAARRFPVVLELLAAGSVNLTTVRLLGPHLTPENHGRVLESARGKRRAEVEEIVARLAPFPEAPPSIRKLPGPRLAYPPPLPRSPEGPFVPFPATTGPPRSASTPLSTGPLPCADPLASAGSPPAASATGAPPSQAPGLPDAGVPAAVRPPTHFYRQPSGEITPLAPDRYKLQCTIDGATLEKLRLAKDMLRHAIPSGDEAAILDRAFTALLADLARNKFAATENPQSARAAAPGSRHVPADVKRTVWLRDLGRCAFVGTDGRRCNDRAFVEFHHVRPYAAGGEATVENIQLRCRRHNGYEARVFFDRGESAGGGVRESIARYSCEQTPEDATGARPSRLAPAMLLPGKRSNRPTKPFELGLKRVRAREQLGRSSKTVKGAARGARASGDEETGREGRPPPRS